MSIFSDTLHQFIVLDGHGRITLTISK